MIRLVCQAFGHKYELVKRYKHKHCKRIVNFKYTCARCGHNKTDKLNNK